MPFHTVISCITTSQLTVSTLWIDNIICSIFYRQHCMCHPLFLSAIDCLDWLRVCPFQVFSPWLAGFLEPEPEKPVRLRRCFWNLSIPNSCYTSKWSLTSCSLMKSSTVSFMTYLLSTRSLLAPSNIITVLSSFCCLASTIQKSLTSCLNYVVTWKLYHDDKSYTMTMPSAPL